MLTKDQLAFRRRGIGGSDANIIMSGDRARIRQLFEEKRGEREPEDLSEVLPVRMGQTTEALNREWFTLKTGRPVVADGDEHMSLDIPWMLCTLDGRTVDELDRPAVFEAKHVAAWRKPPDVYQTYIPQLHHNMIVTGTECAVLSVFFGTLKWDFWDVWLDPDYSRRLIAWETAFWAAVQSGNLNDFTRYLDE